MTPPFPQEASSPQALVDSVTQVVDSLATAPADTSAADTADALTEFSQGVGEASRLIAAGRWSEVVEQSYIRLIELGVSFIPKLLGALFVFLLFYAVYRILGAVLSRVLSRSRRVDSGLRSLLIKSYRVVALIFIGTMVLSQFGVNVAALLAGLSIAGIAVGFAARDTLENFISGITIMLDKPFRIGDNIEVEDTFGTVEEITLRSTRLRTLNNQIAVLPNIQMISQKLVNHTMLNTVRVVVPFGIAYKEYPQEAREVALQTTEGDDRLHPDYPPTVVVTKMNDSSVDMELRLYLRNPKLEVPVRFEYLEKVREALREADIEIPFPHLQLFVDEAKAFDDSFLLHPDWPGARPAPDPPPAEA